ncbi:MAG: oligosaccharide flippase family protein [Halobacteriota archaeon]|nr:oligosaccharide flippase family protein [Halobacteriota archaeon]
MKLAIPKNIDELREHLSDPLFKNSYYMMLTSVIGSPLGFVFWIVVTRFYSTEEVGLAVAIFSATGMIAAFSGLGLNFGVIRFLPKEEDKQGLINSCLTITVLSSVALGTIFIIGLDIFSPALLFIRDNMTFFLFFIIFTPISALIKLEGNIFVALRTAKYSFFQSMIWMGFKIALPIALVSFGVFGIFFSWGIAIFIALIIGSFLFIPKALSSPKKYRPIPVIKRRIIDEMLHFSAGNYVAYLLESAPIMILPLLIVNVLSPEMTAYFYIAWTLAGILFTVSIATNSSLFAEGSNKPEELRRNVIRATKFIFILLIPAIIALFLIGDRLLFFFGDDYSKNAVGMLWILGLSSIPYTLNSIYITIKRVQMETAPIMYLYAFIAIFTLGMSYILMAEIGLIGVGIAWTLGQVIVSIVAMPKLMAI